VIYSFLILRIFY